MAHQLREYQLECSDKTIDYLLNNNGNGLISACVGAGKSLLIAEFIKRALAMFSQAKFVVLSHTAEILEQDKLELDDHVIGISTSYCCESLGKKSLRGQVVFASIQSIYDKALDFRQAPHFVIIDEAHAASHKNDTMYRRFINDMLKVNPDIRILGYTGTPFREGAGRIDEGENALFTDTIYEISLLQLVHWGWLVPAYTPDVPLATHLDISNEKSAEDITIVKQCVAEIMAHTKTRHKTIVFASNLTQMKIIAEEIASYGESVVTLSGKTPKKKRRDTIKAFRNDVRFFVNVGTATTGFNVRSVDTIVFMRAIRSANLYVQMTGRGLRLSPETHKRDCLLLDFGGVVDSLGCIDQVSVPRKNSSDGTEKGRKTADIRNSLAQNWCNNRQEKR